MKSVKIATLAIVVRVRAGHVGEGGGETHPAAGASLEN